MTGIAGVAEKKQREFDKSIANSFIGTDASKAEKEKFDRSIEKDIVAGSVFYLADSYSELVHDYNYYVESILYQIKRVLYYLCQGWSQDDPGAITPEKVDGAAYTPVKECELINTLPEAISNIEALLSFLPRMNGAADQTIVKLKEEFLHIMEEKSAAFALPENEDDTISNFVKAAHAKAFALFNNNKLTRDIHFILPTDLIDAADLAGREDKIDEERWGKNERETIVNLETGNYFNTLTACGQKGWDLPGKCQGCAEASLGWLGAPLLPLDSSEDALPDPCTVPQCNCGTGDNQICKDPSMPGAKCPKMPEPACKEPNIFCTTPEASQKAGDLRIISEIAKKINEDAMNNPPASAMKEVPADAKKVYYANRCAQSPTYENCVAALSEIAPDEASALPASASYNPPVYWREVNHN